MTTEGTRIIAFQRRIVMMRCFTTSPPVFTREVERSIDNEERAQLIDGEAAQENNIQASVISILILYAIGIGLVVLGALNVNNCPAENRISLLLIVLGSAFLVIRLLNAVYDCRRMTSSEFQEKPHGLSAMCFLIVLIGYAIFLTLCYYVFSLKYSSKPEDANYCSSKFYYTNFWGCIAGLVLSILSYCCCFCCYSI